MTIALLNAGTGWPSMGKHTHWTQEEVDTLVKLRRGGSEFGVIADVLNRPYQSITHKWQRLEPRERGEVKGVITLSKVLRTTENHTQNPPFCPNPFGS